ncbi:MAG TPA: hypothetical protein VLA98_14540 [Solirubrobacteraceae bacterium]|nr:hypothetical protein [Solirubrobacteraceae bacterium]
MPGTAAEPCRPSREADVILDVELEDGLLFLVLENFGSRPAHAVRVRFGGPLRGLGGERRVDRLRIFRQLELLPPRRRIRILLDRAALLFAREEPTELEARISWRTDEGERRSRTVRHDLDAYRDFPYLEVPRDAPAS